MLRNKLNYFLMDDNWKICPVTQEQFTVPVIIPCGHTFEKEMLIKLKKKECPTCRNVFHGNPDFFPINWIIVSALNLTISKQDENKDPIPFNAKDALNMANEYKKKVKQEKLVQEKRKILEEICNAANKGHVEMRYYFKHPGIKEEICSYFREMEYVVVTSDHEHFADFIWADETEEKQNSFSESDSSSYDSESSDSGSESGSGSGSESSDSGSESSDSGSESSDSGSESSDSGNNSDSDSSSKSDSGSERSSESDDNVNTEQTDSYSDKKKFSLKNMFKKYFKN